VSYSPYKVERKEVYEFEHLSTRFASFINIIDEIVELKRSGSFVKGV
jgi:hypothetical protein